MVSFDFVTVDVFTDNRFGGNPLAVLTDARGLDPSQMQQIASEFGYSETTFVFPPSDPANTARVRIFTPTTEVPFAGHPNVGTAFVIGEAGSAFGRAVGPKLRFEEQAGLVEITLLKEGSTVSARITAPGPFTSRAGLPVDVIAQCVGLESTDIRTTRHLPVFASVGLEFAIAELTELRALGLAKPVANAFESASCGAGDFPGGLALFVYFVDSEDPLHVRARMFAPLDNVSEDPATGSASGALGGLLASLDPKRNLDLELVIEQGVEMGRPSTIKVSVSKRDSSIASVAIAGQSVVVMRGTFEI